MPSRLRMLHRFIGAIPVLIGALIGVSASTVAAAAAAPLVAGPQSSDYRIHSGDEVEISVWKEPDLIRKLIVRPDGKLSYPLTGELVASGRTAATIQKDVETLLKKYIPEPVVTVTVTGLAGNQIYVLGQINKPGVYMMNPQLTVLQALAVAGGMTPYAAANEIFVLRGQGANQSKFEFRYGDVAKGRLLEQNILLESGDVIVVP